MNGLFFQPKSLSTLSDREIQLYLQVCTQRLLEAGQSLAEIKAENRGLSDGFVSDGIIAIGGLILAGAGIAITAVATAGGILGLAGGAFSLLGLQRYGSRGIKRNLLDVDRANLDQAVKFWRSELANIEQELNRRGPP
ncbi:MAG: hypothetical protein JOZ90_16750 [Alphaproteobacteria bacterium]|nr:hypothetical protein [Alphaproteobacteria bacterium]MBV9371538.1 hypothetical protein [Alphaproteobacteria bacterium]MBV9902720.1 hypothetical protein [Alphaproteobacteria bacterium]